MEATRVGRAARPGRTSAPAKAEVTERMPPPVRGAPRGACALAPPALERLALVAGVLGRERAAALLEGLGEAEAERARAHLSHFMALSSAQRQARVALAFGVGEDAAERLRALMQEASEPLRREIFRRLAPYHRSLFPEREVEPPDAVAPPGLVALAERLIREATR